MTFIPARPTTYRGIAMRSRLEASYAAHMDDESIGWVYEPRAYGSPQGQYLPDFEITELRDGPPQLRTFIEVRPTLERAYLAMSQMPIIWDSEPEARLWIVVPNEIYFTASGFDRLWRVEWSA